MLIHNALVSTEIKIHLAVIEDDNIIRNSYHDLLNNFPDMQCDYTFSNCEDAIPVILEDPPDIILMDIELPGMSGIEGIKKIRKNLDQIDIIAITIHDDEKMVFDALCAGATGYLTKNVSPLVLLESIREVFKGGAPMSTNIARMVIGSFHKNAHSPLTKRETEVLNMLSRGKSYSKIAESLFINSETVKTHLKNIYLKLEVHSKNEAIEKAVKQRLI